jgi:hypothetical protein
VKVLRLAAKVFDVKEVEPGNLDAAKLRVLDFRSLSTPQTLRLDKVCATLRRSESKLLFA